MAITTDNYDMRENIYYIFNGFTFFCNNTSYISLSERTKISFYITIDEYANNGHIGVLSDYIELYKYKCEILNNPLSSFRIFPLDFNRINKSDNINLDYLTLLSFNKMVNHNDILFVITIINVLEQNIKKIIKLYIQDIEFIYKKYIFNDIIILYLVSIKYMIDGDTIMIDIINDLDKINLEKTYKKYMIATKNIISFIKNKNKDTHGTYNIYSNELCKYIQNKF
jgi:hypothetical protein